MALSSTLPREIGLWQIRSIAAQSAMPAALLLFGLTYARGRGNRVSRLWIGTVSTTLAVPVAAVTLWSDRLVALVTMIDDGQPWAVVLGESGIVVKYATLIAAVMILIHLERTFRASVGTMRWRIKFMIIGLAVLLMVRIYTCSQTILFNSVLPSLDLLDSIGLLIACGLMLRTLLRSGHFEIEIYPSQTVLQNSLTIFVVGTYLVAIGLFAKLATLLGAESAFPIKALGILVALVLLGLLLQSDRFQLHLKQFVSRHFKRPLHDYQTVWKRFTEETASHTSQSELCDSLVKLISEVFDSLSVSIWTVDDRSSKLSLAASTSLLDPVGKELPFPPETDPMAILRNRKGIVDLDDTNAPWAEALKDANPKRFPHGGNRICIPMTARNSLLGVIVLGDRIGGMRFATQEFDVLTSVGNHAASSLLNLQLSQKLLETRELEAFQTMAAFFVHDLKNAASTLNIMVKNLPVHWENPEFRTDALRGITKTGERINQLIGRLSSFQGGLEVDARIEDIDDLALSVAENWEAPAGIHLVSECASKAKAKVDADQMRKVLLNLLINASESMDDGGKVTLRTESGKTSVAFSVQDEGCGMSEEFIAKSLFRPFTTTKKRGLGIGMFQSKMIVEAQGGRMEVESESGKGSTFRVVLPRENSS